MIHLDFETRSEVDLGKVGAWNYSTHPSTEILCMAYAFSEGHVAYKYDNWGCYPEGVLYKDMFFVAHNSMFENYIWHNILVKRYGWPVIPLRQWRCTAALAATHALPRSLENAAIALKLKEQKNMEGKRIMLKMCKPRKISKNNKNKWFEDPEDFQKLYDYCIKDVEVERAIHNSLPQLSKKEQELWFLDQMINTRGIQIDQELVYAALYLAEEYIKECNAKLQILTNGYVDKCSQVARMRNWMASVGVHVDSLDKESVAKTLLSEVCSGKVLNVLRLRQEVGKTSVKKFQAIKNAVCSDRKLRDTLVYHGASTGRWTGKIVQPHNLPRGSVKDIELCIKNIKKRNLKAFKFLYPNVMDALSSCVRGALVAAPGKELLVVDFASIEARVLAWIAGEGEALNEYRKGEDSYVKMAEAIYRTDQITKDMRFVGKTAVLGCGYGMGVERFKDTCASMGQEISESLAQQAVTAFRKKNHNIVNFWYKVEEAAMDAVRYRKRTFNYNKANTTKIYWEKVKNFLYCTLPSGRKLAYHYPKISRKEEFNQTNDRLGFTGVALGNKYTEQFAWGGKLVENIVQAIARDLLAEAMLRVETHDYKVILHVHDEIVAEVPEGCNTLQTFISIITTLPDWAEGCPIEAEGWRGKRYKK